MLGRVGSVRAKTSVKKHPFEAIFKKVEMGGEDFQMLGKVGSLRAKTSVKKHLFEAIVKKVEMGGEYFIIIITDE